MPKVVNKVVLMEEGVASVKIDLTADTATAADVMPGKTFHLADGTQATGAWAPRSVPIPSVSVGSYSYDGTVQGPTIGAYDPADVVVTNATAINAGTYTLTVALTHPGITQWSDTTMDAKTYTYTIAVIPVTVPTVTGAFAYDGTQKTATVTGFDASTMTQGGNQSGTDAGTYTVTFDLIDPVNHEWTDHTTAQKTGTWTIAKAAGTVTLSSNTVTLNKDNTSVAVTVGGTGEDWTAASDDTSIATVSKSGNTLTIVSPENEKGTATITVSRPEGTNYTSASATIAVTANFYKIYGVSWDGTSTSALSRTDSAANFTDPVPAVSNGNGSSPFDDILPWSGMQRSTDSAAGTLVSIPKYYYKWTKTGTVMTLQISTDEASLDDGFLVSPAHADRGDGKGERDVVYVGAYHCASTYKSTTGVKPQASKTRSQFRSNIHGLDSTIWQYDFAMYWTIMMLYLVEYADWNSQKKIGYGCGNNSGTENAGLCDNMTYHTGTNASSRTTYGHTRYRYIEDLWGNVLDWVDGIYFSGTNIYCIKNPANFSDSSGGTKTGTRPTSGNCIKAWGIPTAAGFEYALYPSEVVSDSNYATYVCDRCYYGSSGVVLYVGGTYYQIQGYGAFYLSGDYTASDSYSSIGSRLQKLP